MIRTPHHPRAPMRVCAGVLTAMIAAGPAAPVSAQDSAASDARALLHLVVQFTGAARGDAGAEARVERSLDGLVLLSGTPSPFDPIADPEATALRNPGPAGIDPYRYIIWTPAGGACGAGELTVSDQASAPRADEGGGATTERKAEVVGSRTISDDTPADCLRLLLIQDTKDRSFSIDLDEVKSLGADVENRVTRGGTTVITSEGTTSLVDDDAGPLRFTGEPGGTQGTVEIADYFTTDFARVHVADVTVAVDAVVSWRMYALKLPEGRDPAPPPCVQTADREGLAGDRAESLRTALAGTLDGATPAMVAVHGSGPDAVLLHLEMRLGRDARPLPHRDCLMREGRAGNVRPGSQEGAESLLIGALQQLGERTRVTVRTVDVTTGVVTGAGRGDATGRDAAAIQSAAAAAVAALGLTKGGRP